MSKILFKNTDNKVLMSAGGRIISSAYTIPVMFTGRASIPNLSILASTFTFATIFRNNTPVPGLSGSEYPLYSYQTAEGNNVSLTNNPLGAGYVNLMLNNTFTLSGYGILYYQKLQLQFYRNSSVRLNTASYLAFNTSSLYSNTINTVFINCARLTTGVGATTQNAYNYYNATIVYNRDVSLSEEAAIYMNGTYSEPPSLVGVKSYVVYTEPEILDFSLAQNGSDMQVGFRDISGNNRHALVLQIPAGTLEYKLNYVKTTWMKVL